MNNPVLANPYRCAPHVGPLAAGAVGAMTIMAIYSSMGPGASKVAQSSTPFIPSVQPITDTDCGLLRVEYQEAQEEVRDVEQQAKPLAYQIKAAKGIVKYFEELRKSKNCSTGLGHRHTHR